MHDITCPSGLRGSLRGMKVRDEQLLIDKKHIKSGHTISALLESCWTQTLDLGPYSKTRAFSWRSAAAADRTYALLQLRIASYGPTYDFNVICQDDGCKRKFIWSLDLNELECRPVSPEGKAFIATGTPFEIVLPSGLKALCKIQTGEDEAKLLKVQKDEGHAYASSIVASLVQLGSATELNALIAAVEDLEAADADVLADTIEEHAGGPDLSFAVECPSCEGQFQVRLPFKANFFSKRKQLAPTHHAMSG